jgi:hypothetical protein
MNRITNTIARIFAVFAASGLSVIGAGALAGVSTLKAVTIAGITGVATVVERLARSFLDDGKLDKFEIDAAFSQIDSKSLTEEDIILEKKKSSKA